MAAPRVDDSSALERLASASGGCRLGSQAHKKEDRHANAEIVRRAIHVHEESTTAGGGLGHARIGGGFANGRVTLVERTGYTGRSGGGSGPPSVVTSGVASAAASVLPSAMAASVSASLASVPASGTGSTGTPASAPAPVSGASSIPQIPTPQGIGDEHPERAAPATIAAGPTPDTSASACATRR